MSLLAAVLVPLLACKQKDGACSVATDCPVGQACVSGACVAAAAPEPTVTEAPKPVETAPPVPSKTCALIALSGVSSRGYLSAARECDVDIEDDGDTLKSSCALAMFVTPKGGRPISQGGGRMTFKLEKKSSDGDVTVYKGTGTDSSSFPVMLKFSKLYDTANGQISISGKAITLTFRPCKKKD
ncbi:MAG: hypothetical protein H6718_35890 [Polyangiaceae bacterium]|nr:hypothetical protein [Myxococcales bacterium]MCB9590842.1 hypothetical protein [Polyangiaceae bacterium]